MKRQEAKQEYNTASIKDYATTITILEHISDAIFILTHEGRIQYANTFALQLLNSKLRNLLGKQIHEIIDLPAVNKNSGMTLTNEDFLQEITSGLYQEFETTLKGDGGVNPVMMSFGVIRNSSDRPLYIIASAKDISLRKKLELDLAEQQARIISRDRVRAMGELSVGLVHELSQPLASIKLTLEMLEKTVADEKAAGHIRQLHSLTDQVSLTVQNIRDFAGKTENENVAMVALGEALQNARNLIEYELLKRNIGVSVDFEEELPLVLANPVSIEQVFVTLFTNAWNRFDREKEQAGQGSNDEKWIRISARDFGKKWIEIVFEDNAVQKESDTPVRMDGRISAVQEIVGNEMSLMIIKSIISDMGGDVRIGTRRNSSNMTMLRLPADQPEERQQLFNLIEMLHQ